jgi:hypothetical protein
VREISERGENVGLEGVERKMIFLLTMYVKSTLHCRCGRTDMNHWTALHLKFAVMLLGAVSIALVALLPEG